MTMNKWICTLLLCFSVSLLCGQTRVSGVVRGDGRPLKGVVVKEIDANNRIVSQATTNVLGLYNMIVKNPNHTISVKVEGYLDFNERLHGRNKLDIGLVKAVMRVDKELLMAKRKSVESYKLIYGRSGTRQIPQLVRLEMLNDTLLTMIIPIHSSSLTESYPAERSLIFVDYADNQLLVGYNAIEVYTISGEPEDGISQSVIARTYVGIDYVPASSMADAPMYVYPQFLFTIQGLSKLLEQEDRIYRLLIDTARGDDFWQLFPSETFGKEMRKLIAKFSKKKKRQ